MCMYTKFSLHSGSLQKLPDYNFKLSRMKTAQPWCWRYDVSGNPGWDLGSDWNAFQSLRGLQTCLLDSRFCQERVWQMRVKHDESKGQIYKRQNMSGGLNFVSTKQKKIKNLRKEIKAKKLCGKSEACVLVWCIYGKENTSIIEWNTAQWMTQRLHMLTFCI